MSDIYTQLKQVIADQTKLDNFSLTIPPQADFGDLSTNVALLVAKQKNQDPQATAKELATALQSDPWLVANDIKITIAGQGFINFFMPASILSAVIWRTAWSKKFTKKNLTKRKKIIIEYSSPNTNKPLHLGHLRNDAIGMSLAKIYEHFGYQVIKTEVINDRGIHIMKSLLAYQKWGQATNPKKEGCKGDKLVGNFYVQFNQAAKQDPGLLAEAAALLQAWEKKDKKVVSLWEKLNTWVYNGWQQTYKIYNSKFDVVYYESKLYDQGREIIKRAGQQGIVKQNSEGAWVIDLSAYGLGGRDSGEKVLLRPDGTTVYMTQDIYLAVKRYQDFAFDKMIYVVGDEQIYHFKVLFKLLEILGFSWYQKCQHYPYGQVLLPSGKMKSREGTVVDADDLINDLTNRALVEVKKRQTHLSVKKQTDLATTIAVAAIKYWFLKTSPKSTITFDPQASLSLEGNTGPYLLYTLVRLKKVISRAKVKKIKAVIYQTEEIPLVRKIWQFPLALQTYFDRQQANYLTEYLYSLASLVNNYYQQVPILRAPEKIRQQRLQLIRAAANILELGLDLLNIKTVDKM